MLEEIYLHAADHYVTFVCCYLVYILLSNRQNARPLAGPSYQIQDFQGANSN